MKFYLVLIIALLIIGVNWSCKKLIDVDAPVTNLNSANVYSDEVTAIAAVTNIFLKLSSTLDGGSFATGGKGISLVAGLSADELSLYDGVTNRDLISFYTNDLNINNHTTANSYWSELYAYIFLCNSAVEGLNSSQLDKKVKDQLIGEVKFLRAFFHFYLVNLYGPIPVVTTTDFKANSLSSRNSTAEVYAKIVEDLTEAANLLSSEYLDGRLKNNRNYSERVRPTKWAAMALLAKVYLYSHNFSNAAQTATKLINNTDRFALLPLNDVFLMNSKEAIWQLQATRFGHNTEDAWIFIIPETGPTDYVLFQRLSSFLK